MTANAALPGEATQTIRRFPDPVHRVHLCGRLRHGVMQRGPCEVCGAPDTQAHHSDYTRPRDVTWLCRTHHEELHHPSGTRSA